MKTRYTAELRTLVFLLNGSDVLLIERSAQARLFPGYYNGIGGHVERGEDVLAAAMREVTEETGLRVARLELRGVLSIAHSQYHDRASVEDAPGALVFVFVGQTTERRVTPSDEGDLSWVALDRLRDYRLMPDLYDLLPRWLSRSAVDGPLFLVR
jgi:8-oxo-dGTP diphosphatase